MSCTSLPRLFTSAIFFLGLAAVGIPAVSAAAQNRITAEVTNGRPVAIPGSVHPKAKLGTDLGPAPSSTPLGMSIRFNMSAAQEAALDQLLADQQNPASPKYHQWLTPAQFGAQFGMSSADLAKVSAWLTSQGFTVTGVANGATFITFDGTVGQAQTAFATSIHNILVGGETHYANVTEVSVPAAFASTVEAITGLHDFRLKPRVHASVIHPDFTSSQSGDHFIAPGDIDTIYGVNSLAASANGTGVKIAVTGQVDINTADVAAFRSASGLSTTNLPTTVIEGCDPGTPRSGTYLCNGVLYSAPAAGDLDESSIDVEWSGAMAPSASILFVTGPDVMIYSMTNAIDDDLAPIVTTSYGNCEAGWGYTELLSMNSLFKQANTQGQTVLAAAGDEGAADCDIPGESAAIEGLAVDFPGSSPYVTSMGGTMFSGDAEATGSGSTWAATQYWAGTSGSDVISSALSYIPELPWNDSTYGFDSAGSDFRGGGGGPSAFFTKPAWQVGTGVPTNDGSRDVPDLALDASDAHDPLLFCVDVAQGESCTNGFRVSGGGLNTAGGTSFDSQIFGGMLALIEQKLGSFGNINPTLYALANNSTYYKPGSVSTSSNGYVFNDIISGSNAVPCIAGSPNCPGGGTEGFSAGNGYDLASGWGSVNLSNLATAWTKVTPLGVGSLGGNISSTTLTTSSGTTASVAATTTVTLTATVSGPAATPTGTVQFLTNDVPLGAPVPLLAGVATYPWVTSCSNFGPNSLAASYSGDANYQGSKGPVLTANGTEQNSGLSVNTPIQIQVTGSTCADFSISTPSTVTVAAGGTIPAATITVTPTNGFVGTITFSVVTTSTTAYSPTFTFSPASVSITSSTTTATTSLALAGITASLHLPNAPGRNGSGMTLAQNSGHGVPRARETWYATGSGAAIACMLLLTVPRRRRRLGGLLLVALAVALIGGATGCGSSQSSPPTTTTNPNGYAGDYYVTIVGTYTNSTTGQIDVHSTTVTYAIN